MADVAWSDSHSGSEGHYIRQFVHNGEVGYICRGCLEPMYRPTPGDDLCEWCKCREDTSRVRARD
jgi:hypothetical protein